jgi:type IV pilus assembly protein PilV
MKIRRLRRKLQRGVVLLEALVSILIFSLGVLGLVAIQAQSIKAAKEVQFRTDAVFAANELLGRIWVDRANLATYAGTTTLATLPSGQRVVAVSGAVVTVTITWRPPGESADRNFVTRATLVSN